MTAQTAKIMLVFLFAGTLVVNCRSFFNLKHLFMHMDDLMNVEEILKFKMTSVKHKTVRVNFASLNSDMYFKKHNGNIEVFGTENYRPANLRYYDCNDKLSKLEKQFLIDFAAQHEPLSEHTFAADWYFMNTILTPDLQHNIEENSVNLFVIAQKFGDARTTGKSLFWSTREEQYDPYDREGKINIRQGNMSGLNDNIAKMLLQNGKKLKPVRMRYPNEHIYAHELSSALQVGQKSALIVLQNNEEKNVNEIKVEVDRWSSRDDTTAFFYAVSRDMLLVVDEMLKNHKPDLTRTTDDTKETVLHLATSVKMLKLLVTDLKGKELLKTVMDKKDRWGGYPEKRKRFQKNMAGRDFLYNEYRQCSSLLDSTIRWFKI